MLRRRERHSLQAPSQSESRVTLRDFDRRQAGDDRKEGCHESELSKIFLQHGSDHGGDHGGRFHSGWIRAPADSQEPTLVGQPLEKVGRTLKRLQAQRVRQVGG